MIAPEKANKSFRLAAGSVYANNTRVLLAEDLRKTRCSGLRHPRFSLQPEQGFPGSKMVLLAQIAAANTGRHIHCSNVVFIDVRSASAALGLALTWRDSVDKTRALNDRR
jgi:hypothetical protein